VDEHGSTRAWRKLRAKVLREEPECRIQGPGCIGVATTVDHIVPRSVAPQLTMTRTNLRGACARCNYSRGNARTTKPSSLHAPERQP
jgi:5-methylcytosine-specific restriction endonuclease McrA